MQIVYLATFGIIFLAFVFKRYKKMIKSRILLKKTTFNPIIFFFLRKEGRSFQTREREIIDLYLKRDIVGRYYY